MRAIVTASVLSVSLFVGGSGAAADSTVASACHFRGHLPDRRCTPGATDPQVTQANIGRTVCVSGWTDRVRPPTSVTNPIKTQREIAYGIGGPHPKPFRVEELDHLIPLELGGAPRAVANLWPEAVAGSWGYRRKDRIENNLKRLVCARSLSLRMAQRAIAGDWVAAYRRYVTN